MKKRDEIHKKIREDMRKLMIYLAFTLVTRSKSRKIYVQMKQALFDMIRTYWLDLITE